MRKIKASNDHNHNDMGPRHSPITSSPLALFFCYLVLFIVFALSAACWLERLSEALLFSSVCTFELHIGVCLVALRSNGWVLKQASGRATLSFCSLAIAMYTHSHTVVLFPSGVGRWSTFGYTAFTLTTGFLMLCIVPKP